MSIWHSVKTDARIWVADAIASGDLDIHDDDAREQWIHETADGSSYVIYYDNQWALYRDPECPVDYEDAPEGDVYAQLAYYAYNAVTYALGLEVMARMEA